MHKFHLFIVAMAKSIIRRFLRDKYGKKERSSSLSSPNEEVRVNESSSKNVLERAVTTDGEGSSAAVTNITTASVVKPRHQHQRYQRRGSCTRWSYENLRTLEEQEAARIRLQGIARTESVPCITLQGIDSSFRDKNRPPSRFPSLDENSSSEDAIYF